MTNNTLFVGVALIVLGLFGYFNGVSESKKKAEEATLKAKEADKDAAAVEPEAVSKTALIPAGVGAVFLVCVAVIVFNNNLLKHAMHAAAVVGVIGFLGGFMPVMRGGLDWSKTGVKVGLMMSLVCAIFVGLCVKSFIDARKAGQPAG